MQRKIRHPNNDYPVYIDLIFKKLGAVNGHIHDQHDHAVFARKQKRQKKTVEKINIMEKRKFGAIEEKNR